MAHVPAFPGPTVAAIGERLFGRIDELADELTAAIRAAEPFYDAGNVVPTADLRSSIHDNLVYILSRLAGRATSDLGPPRATGRRRAEQGAPLPAILHSYRVAGTHIWSAIVEEGLGLDGNAEALLPAASELWSIMDELSSSVTDAYRETVVELTRSHAQTRNAMLDVLLHGDTGDGSRLWESAAGLRLPRQGVFVVAAAHAERLGAESIPHAEEALRARDIESAWRVEIDAHVGVVVLTPRNTIDRLCALLADLAGGPVGVSEQYHSLEQTPTALRQARLAYATGAQTERGVIRYEQVPIAVLLASAPDAAANVAHAVLGPVLALPAQECQLLLATLRAWFAEDGATSAAAAKLYLHRNTVRYRLRRVEELTGRSLTRPNGIAELHLALEAARILQIPM
ncbi:PucR family transcriptional regulator [Dactylosporangium darangshiense]|uniref:Helix-turn-helix domain-containing protein n=1 Tax=Dactylosporangium darangshiense TaxID=579108 RepID=A0ABP8DHM6_9ACTN